MHDVEMANVAQLVMLTGARLAIGVQGGIATLGSAVGARMLLLCKAGSECYDTNKTQDFNQVASSDALAPVDRHGAALDGCGAVAALALPTLHLCACDGDGVTAANVCFACRFSAYRFS